jgi:two-component system CheB/CheR fusion protein
MTPPNPRVLLLEDNPVLAESIAFALRTYGLEVVGPFASNDLADCEVSKENLAVGVLDLELEKGDSTPTALRLREAGVPFLFMSGHSMEDELPAEFQNEICLPKPISPEVLAEVIQELREDGAVSGTN